MRLYVAGPMATYPERNAPAFREAAAVLRALGFDVTSPAELHGPDWPPADGHEATADERAEFLRVDVAAMLAEGCEGLALLDGWHRSRGANVEHTLARALGMPCEPVGLWIAAGSLAQGRGVPTSQLHDPLGFIWRVTDPAIAQ